MGDEIVVKLRDEIMESQKARLSLLKWKLILVAALGAAALGVGDRDARGFPLLLGLIPLVCVFVDLVCYHVNVRVHVIGAFLRTELGVDDVASKYEKYAQLKRDVFWRETSALAGASVFASAIVAIAGLVFLLRWHGAPLTCEGNTLPTGWLGSLLILSGALGCALAIGVHRHYRTSISQMSEAGKGKRA
jgi:hypothetical protein